MENIIRESYLKSIRPYYGKGLIKAFIGQRRVGKSFILKQVADELRQIVQGGNLILIDKEQFVFDSLNDYTQLYTFVKQHCSKGANILLVDEIQEITGFEKALRSLLAEGNFDIYCTGRNSKLLTGELATLLSGRQITIPVFSLSFNEFLLFHRLPGNRESLELYLKYGGMPYLVHLPKEDSFVFDYLKNINDTILYRDILSRYEIRDVGFLTNLLHYLADNTGSMTVAKRISDFMKAQGNNKAVSAILSYLNYLHEANFILFAPRYDIQGKRIFENGGKYYFQDHGMRNAIAGFKPNDIGKLVENVVFKHLITLGFKVYIGDLKGKEIDFVAEKQGEKVYVQATFSLADANVVEREFGNLMSITDQYPKYVVSLNGPTATGTFDGVYHLSLLEFLQKEEL